MGAGRVIPRHHQIEAAIRNGEQRFAAIGCATATFPRCR
jgi:hypothetical protein